MFKERPEKLNEALMTSGNKVSVVRNPEKLFFHVSNNWDVAPSQVPGKKSLQRMTLPQGMVKHSTIPGEVSLTTGAILEVKLCTLKLYEDKAAAHQLQLFLSPCRIGQWSTDSLVNCTGL